VFKELKMKAWDEESKMARMESTREEYHNAGPSQ